MLLQFDNAEMAEKPRTPGGILRDARKRKGLSQEELAKRGNTTRQQISRLEKDERDLDRDWARRLGPHIDMRPRDLWAEDDAEQGAIPSRRGRIPVLGEVAAGRWIEVDAFDREPEEWLPFVPVTGMSTEGVYALAVRGNSMDQVAPDGSIVICRDVSMSGIEPDEADYVIVERLRAQEGLREVTMKRVRTRPRGGIELVPESSDPRWKPVLYTGRKQADALDLRVIAAVEYIVMPLSRARRR